MRLGSSASAVVSVCSIAKLIPLAFAMCETPGHIRLKGAGQGGYNGTRVGEASHPGPPLHTSPLHPAVGRSSSLPFRTPPRGHVANTFAAHDNVRSKSRSGNRQKTEPSVDEAADGVRRLGFDEGMPPRQQRSGVGRLCCPVLSCPCADAACIPKWSEAVLNKHVDAHLSGQLAGRVPAQWLIERGKVQCRVCGLGVASRLEVHPTCRPSERRQRRPEQQTSAEGATPVLPTLPDVCNGRVRTLKYVPAKAKAAWAKALVRSLALVVHLNTLSAWTEFAMLPACTLCPPPRQGHSSSADTAAFTLDRLSRWEAGERTSLWVDRTVLPFAPSSVESAAERRKFLRAEALCREGLVGKACAALASDGICAPNKKSLADIVALHPPAALPVLPPDENMPPAPVLEVGVVSKCLQYFPKAQQQAPPASECNT